VDVTTITSTQSPRGTGGGRAKHILIVDDDPEVCQVLAEYIGVFRHAHPYEVSVALDGTDAFMQILQRRPDLLLIDLRMPRMGGLALLRELRARGIRIPAIVITGSNDLGEITKVLDAEVFAFAPKPVSLDYLEHLVALALFAGKAQPALVPA